MPVLSVSWLSASSIKLPTELDSIEFACSITLSVIDFISVSSCLVIRVAEYRLSPVPSVSRRPSKEDNSEHRLNMLAYMIVIV